MNYQDDIKALKDVSGIYKITCIANGRFYIGSTWSLHKRFKEHFHDLNRGKHSSRKLLNAWLKYGKDKFIFEVIERCEIDILIPREQFYLDTLRPYDRGVGFNNSPTAHSILGLKKDRVSVDKQVQSLSERFDIKKIMSPDGIIFEFKMIRTFARQHGLSATCLADVLNGDIRYTKGGWKLPNTIMPDYKLIDPNNQIIVVPHMGLVKFCKARDLYYNAMRRLATGKQKSYKGWKATNTNETTC